jgi:hypothetical protein
MTSRNLTLQIEEGQRGDTPPLPGGEVETLSRMQAVDYLRERWGLAYAPRTLKTYAIRGTGPEYFRLGARVAYMRDALDEWARSKVTGPGRKASELKPLNAYGGVKA